MIEPSRSSPPKHITAGEPGSPSGGFFHVRAVGAGAGGLWTFSFGGKTLTAKTAASLLPGVFYTGSFIRKKNGFEFVPRGGISGGGAGSPVVSRLPIPGTPEFCRFALARAFSQAGASLPQGAAYEELLKFVPAKSKRETLARAALAARCGEKGLALNTPAYESLHAVLSGYSGGRDGRRRGSQDGNEPENREAAPVPESASADSGRGGGEEALLLLFNHTATGTETWTVYPYRCTADGRPCAGSLRVLYSRREKTAKKQVLLVRPEEENAAESGVWHFVWENVKGRLKIYYSGSLPRETLLPDTWKRKFHKLGLYSDDIVYNGDNFDGFSGEWEDAAEINEMA